MTTSPLPQTSDFEVYKCGVSWCDVYNMTPWKAQCSYEGTDECGVGADWEMDKTKIAKMDMEAFRQLKDAEYELNKWRNLAGAMHQYIIDGNTAGAIEAYEDVCDGLYDKVYERMIKDA